MNLHQRNYHLQPLILRDYRREFYVHIILNFILWIYGAMIFMSAYEADHIDFEVKLKRFIIFFCVYFAFLFIPFLLILVSKPRYIKLNGYKKAVYCDSKLVPLKKYPLMYQKMELVSAYHAIAGMKWYILPGAFIFILFGGIIVVFLLSIVLGLVVLNDILLRMLIWKKSNKNLKNFWKYSQNLVIDIGWKRSQYFTKEGATLYFFNQQDHDELREYFLANFNVDIDTDIRSVDLF